MHELTMNEVEQVSGGITAFEGAGLILGVGAFAASSPFVVALAFGAAGGLIIAKLLADR